MKNLSPATRQKLAILLKSKAKANGGVLPPKGSPNLQPPPMSNGMSLPKSPSSSQNIFQSSQNQLNPGFFNIKNKLKPI